MVIQYEYEAKKIFQRLANIIKDFCQNLLFERMKEINNQRIVRKIKRGGIFANGYNVSAFHRLGENATYIILCNLVKFI